MISRNDLSNRIETVPAIYFEITNKIVNQANKELDTDLVVKYF